jgi:drug/metabolite transporter (DMT)-like permease
MRTGFFLAAVAGIAWGTIPLAVKQVYATGSATALEISFFRFVIAFCVIFPVTALKGECTILKDKWSILMGFWGVFWMSLISFYGIQYTSAVNATILFNANPLFVVALVILLKWEKINFLIMTGIFLGITGVVMVSGVAGIHVVGDLLVLLGAFGWAVYTVLGYKLRKYSSFSLITSSLFWGLLFFVVSFAWLRDIPFITGSDWVWVIYIGLVPTAAAFVLYIKAVDIIGSTRASVFQYLAPAVAVLLSFGFGLEKISLFQISGIVLIVLGIELTRR